MAAIEQAEVERYKDRLEADLRHLLDRYLRILEWDVPEADEELARKLILDEMERALARMRLLPPARRPSGGFMA
jgi:hypothetical protein